MSTCYHEPWNGQCVICNAPRTVCRHCGIDIGASGADGGSWVPFEHWCETRPRTASTDSLSARIRAGCEAAPWVIDAVQRLEAETDRLRAALRQYGRHRTTCPASINDTTLNEQPCRCGFSNVL